MRTDFAKFCFFVPIRRLNSITSSLPSLVIRLPKEKIRLPGEVNHLVILGKTRDYTQARARPQWDIGLRHDSRKLVCQPQK